MQISEEEILHIANLANLEIKKDEIEKYSKNLEEILEFANVINNVQIGDLQETIAINKSENVFREDEIKVFQDSNALLENAPDKEKNMFKIPKVIN